MKKAKAISDCSDTAFGSLPVEKAVEEVAFADQSKDGWGFRKIIYYVAHRRGDQRSLLSEWESDSSTSLGRVVRGNSLILNLFYHLSFLKHENR